MAAGIGKQADRTDGACAGDYRDCLNKTVSMFPEGTMRNKSLLGGIVFCFVFTLGVRASGIRPEGKFYIIQP